MTNIVWNFIMPNPAFYFYIDKRLFFFLKQAVDFSQAIEMADFYQRI